MRILGACAVLWLTLLVMPGCKPKEEPPPPPPPLPSEGSIYSTVRETLHDILDQGGATDEVIQQTLIKFKQALNENAGDPTLYTPEQIEVYENARKAARRRVQDDIVNQIRSSRDAGGWRMVKGAIQAYKVLQPESKTYDSLLEKAEKMINMPRIVCRGNQIVDGQTSVFFEIQDPKTGLKLDTVYVRKGETFFRRTPRSDDLFLLVDIIGDNLEYKVQYLEVENHTFTVPGIKR